MLYGGGLIGVEIFEKDFDFDGGAIGITSTAHGSSLIIWKEDDRVLSARGGEVQTLQILRQTGKYHTLDSFLSLESCQCRSAGVSAGVSVGVLSKRGTEHQTNDPSSSQRPAEEDDDERGYDIIIISRVKREDDHRGEKEGVGYKLVLRHSISR